MISIAPAPCGAAITHASVSAPALRCSMLPRADPSHEPREAERGAVALRPREGRLWGGHEVAVRLDVARAVEDGDEAGVAALLGDASVGHGCHECLGGTIHVDELRDAAPRHSVGGVERRVAAGRIARSRGVVVV
eukprot:3938327-Rhodomonas_salina.2